MIHSSSATWWSRASPSYLDSPNSHPSIGTQRRRYGSSWIPPKHSPWNWLMQSHGWCSHKWFWLERNRITRSWNWYNVDKLMHKWIGCVSNHPSRTWCRWISISPSLVPRNWRTTSRSVATDWTSWHPPNQFGISVPVAYSYNPSPRCNRDPCSAIWCRHRTYVRIRPLDHFCSNGSPPRCHYLHPLQSH